MSRKAGEARQRNLARVKRLRTPEHTWRIQLEIALWTHRRGESLRALAARLGLKSYAHCWRVARDYRAGLLEWLSPTESGLLAMRDSLDGLPRPCFEPPPSPGAPPHVAPPEPERHFYADVGRWMTANERIDEECAARAREAHEEQRKHPLPQRGGRRTFSTVPPWLRPKPNLDWDW